METIVLIAGSRSFKDCWDQWIFRKLNKLWKTLDFLDDETSFKIISGGAPGIDQVAEKWAEMKGFAFQEYPADWSQGRGAGHARNAVMGDACNYALIMWDGRSPGTRGMINILLSKRKRHVVWTDGQ